MCCPGHRMYEWPTAACLSPRSFGLLLVRTLRARTLEAGQGEAGQTARLSPLLAPPHLGLRRRRAVSAAAAAGEAGVAAAQPLHDGEVPGGREHSQLNQQPVREEEEEEEEEQEEQEQQQEQEQQK